ncbi:MAG: Microtubule-associated protein, microtubule dynamics during spindle orientation [Phylliscum demangeonii]|nr:MAG: Microtubule-associated protein, microtubule dynamics during spindle orientation [Phylliscum demangeonii]
MGDQEPDYSSLPLLERFAHKVWKVRKEAYEEAAKLFEKAPDEQDPVYKPFLQDPGLWKGAVADSNVAAQQEGINAICCFLKYAGTPACTRTRREAVFPLVEKGLSSTRAATKASSLEALLLYVELDAPGPVIEEILPALSHKQPKIIAAALNALTALYHAYGTKTIDPKPVLKILPKVFAHADKNVRAEAQNLAVELYRWLREAMKPVFWGELKPVQQQDLEALFEKAKGEPAPKPERLLRSQQQAMAVASSDAAEDGEASGAAEAGAEEAAEVDTFDLVEPVDVISKMPGDFHDQVASTKWKDRKDTLDALFAVVNVPRIKESDFNEVVRALAKCMKDANIAVVTVAANCVEVLAKGTRSHFGRYRSTILSPMLERLKEKKQSVAVALGAAMDAVFASAGLSDCLEETLEFLKHKNPQVKQESLRFLVRCLSTTKHAPSKAEVKNIAEAATKLMTESTENLRSGGAEILGTVMKIMGERAMNPFMDGLDDIRRTKVKEWYEKAEVKAKDKPQPAAPPPAAAASKAAKGAAGKKVGEKKATVGAATSKKATPASSAVTDASSLLQPKPTARGMPSKIGAPPFKAAAASGSGPGLRLPKKLIGTASATASPMKAAAAAHAEDEATPIAAPRFGLGGRGLAGRPLGRPPSATSATTGGSETAGPSAAAMPSTLSIVERAELDELRAETDRLRRIVEEVRSERANLTSQVHELQNQNAQLIEDHTRDVLSIKAKETQLVRARSDAEAAQQMCQRQQREMERLKRELGRAVRAASPGPGSAADVSDQIYRDTGLNGISSAAGRPLTTMKRAPFSAHQFHTHPGEEKENGGPEPATYGVDLRAGLRMTSPSLSAGSGGGRNSPARSTSAGTRDVSAGSGAGPGQGSGAGVGVGVGHAAAPTTSSATAGDGGIETWKRAAEVTSQLKARIEQMKARQGLSKPS